MAANYATLDIMDCKRVKTNRSISYQLSDNKYINNYIRRTGTVVGSRIKNDSGSDYKLPHSNLLCRSAIKRAIYIFLTVSIILFCIIAFSEKAEARDNNTATVYKYYHAYHPEYGETLWDIARDNAVTVSYEDYINEVKSINNLQNDNIYAGQLLVVPYYSTEYKE